MKKVIERMGAAAAAEQQRALATTAGPPTASAGLSDSAGKSGKRRWLGLRKSSATGAGKDESRDESEAADNEGLQVDYYLVIVRPSHRLDPACLICIDSPCAFALVSC